MKKIIKFLLVISIVLIICINTLPRYIGQKTDVSWRVGEAWHGGEISVTEYQAITKYIDYFLSLLKENRLEEAYAMTTPQYRYAQSFDDFKNQMTQNSFPNMTFLDMTPLTQYLRRITLKDNETNETIDFLALFSDNDVDIVPGLFLEKKEYDQEKKKANISYSLLYTENYANQFVLHLAVNNQRKTNILLDDVSIEVEGLRAKRAEEKIPVLAKSQQEIEISFDTNLYFPSKIRLTCYDEQTNKVLGKITFDL